MTFFRWIFRMKGKDTKFSVQVAVSLRPVFHKKIAPESRFRRNHYIILISGLFLRCEFLLVPFLYCHGDIVHDRSGDEDGCVCTYCDTDAERYCHTPDHFTSEDRDGYHHYQGREAGVHGT